MTINTYEYDVGHNTGFVEALDEMKLQIMLKHCQVQCGHCKYVVCPYDTIADEIKERYDDKIQSRRGSELRSDLCDV